VNRHARFFSSVMALSLVLPYSAHAQSESVSEANQGSSSDNVGDIIVTADRRSQRLSDVPSAIIALDGDAISERGLREVRDLEAVSPNLAIRAAYGNAGNPIITIRGVGLADFNENNSSSAGVYVDDIYLVSPVMLTFGLFDTERVELLKGPQGTLYGRNTTSGAINFISRQPTAQFQANAKLSYDNFDRFNAEIGAGGPLSDTLGIRVAALTDVGGDYIDNRFIGKRTGGRDLFAGRFMLKWEPSADFNALFNVHTGSDRSDIGHYQHVGLLDPVTFAPCAPLLTKGVPDSTCVDILGYADTVGDTQAGEYNKTGKVDYDSWGTSLVLKYDFGGFNLTSISGYEKFDGTRPDDADASANQLLEIDYAFGIDQFSQELRLSGETGPVDWILGGYFGTDTITSRNVYDVLRDLRPSTGFDPINGVNRAANPYRQKTDTYAIFGHTVWSLTDQLKFEAGLRYSYERRTFRTVTLFEESPADLASISLGPDGVFLDESRSLRNENILWSANLNYKTDGGTLLYAKIGNGFKSGGFNGGIPLTAAEVVPYRPEKLTSYEAGVKGSMLNRAVRFDLNAFYYDYRDMQVFAVVDSGGAAVQILTNAANSRIYGAEASVTAQLAPTFEVSTSVGLLNARYRDANIAGRDASGQRLATSPKLSVTTGFDFNQPLGSVNLLLSGNAKYQSSEIMDVYDFGSGPAFPIIQKPYWLVDGRMGIGSSDERIELTVFVKNLFDLRPLNGALGLPTYGLGEYSYQQQRQIGVALFGKF
jgi:iron complex outermembrane receptor protein